MKTVHIVYGPPLAGKSTFVRENMGPDDLVFDMDAVQNALCYGADHAGKPHTLGAAIALRNAFIAYLNNKRQDARGDAWVIISSASPEYFARRFFGARIEVTRLLPPLDVCLKRLELDDTRPDKSFWRQALREWSDEYAEKPLREWSDEYAEKPLRERSDEYAEKHGPMYWADADAAESGAQNA